MRISEQRAALKEWASAVHALASGRQILIMRKGGIVEETRHFELRETGFFLYPTYEHQKKHLLKDACRELIDRTTADWQPDQPTVKIETYAEAVRDLEVTSQEELDRLRDYHIWTDEFASERLKWKKTQPLHVILLRVYKLAVPLEAPILPEYNGCKSWIELKLPEHLHVEGVAAPVMTDEQFEAERQAILKQLGRG